MPCPPQWRTKGNLLNVNYPAGTTDLTYTYDALSRLKTMVDAVGTTTYTYDNGLLQSEDGPWTGMGDTVTYSYNTARLRSQMVLSQPTGTAWTTSYTWDSSKRLSTVTSPAWTHPYHYNAQGTLPRHIRQLIS